MIDDLIGTMTSVLRTSLLYRSRIRNRNYKVSKHSHKITFDITRCAVCHKMSAFVHSYITSNISSLKHGISRITTLNCYAAWVSLLIHRKVKEYKLGTGSFLWWHNIRQLIKKCNTGVCRAEINAHMLKTHNLIFLESLMVPRIYSGNFIIQTSVSGGSLTMQNIPLVI